MKSSVDGLSSKTEDRGKGWKREQQKLPTMNNTEKIELGAGGCGGERSLRGLWDYNKRSNISVTGVPEGKEKEGRVKYIYIYTHNRIMSEYLPNLLRDKHIDSRN